jgi:hypothetical protein
MANLNRLKIVLVENKKNRERKICRITMKKKILSMTFTLILFASCLPGWGTMERMRIKNCTTDTILIGASFSNNIDSVYINVYGGRFRFLPCSGDTCDYTWTTINEKGMLEIRPHDYIPQDSTADYAESGTLFSHNKEHKAYLFIIKLETARNHTWAEICRDQLYDTLFVTREMLDEGNRIEYHGN